MDTLHKGDNDDDDDDDNNNNNNLYIFDIFSTPKVNHPVIR
jgi:hypothetical protein